MKQYLDLLKTIQKKGTWKEAARENMPRTLSLFGYQFRHNLQDGFPLLTTKQLSFKNIVTELLWFLRGDTNIKYLVDNGCNIWNEDAYNYYKKILKNHDLRGDGYFYEEFINVIKEGKNLEIVGLNGGTYKLGDCGKQYGWLWRKWETNNFAKNNCNENELFIKDQIKELIIGLKENPMSRRHIITAWNPATLDDMALNACHAFVQFNCRPLTAQERYNLITQEVSNDYWNQGVMSEKEYNDFLDQHNIPKYYLDCQMYQRSADVFLGVPYNIASYSLLTEILAKICNMVPGEFIHTFGDVHIYENHMDSINEQLKRKPATLPNLNINTKFWLTDSGECGIENLSIQGFLDSLNNEYFIRYLIEKDIQLYNYNPQKKIKGKLSTGLN